MHAFLGLGLRGKLAPFMPALRKELVSRWKPTLQTLDPLRELSVDEIEALYAERRPAPYRDIAMELALADEPATVKTILCGARGSGKSTELTRLAREVNADFCVVHTDLAAGLPEEASTLAIVTLLGVAALHAMKEWSGEDDAHGAKRDEGAGKLQKALEKFGDTVPKVSTLLGGISAVVTLFDPEVGGVLSAGHAVAKSAATAVGAGAELRHALARGPLEGRLDPQKRDDAKAVVDAVNGILADLKELAGRPPLLLVDGLDKRTKVEEVEIALSEEYLLRELQAPLILTRLVDLRHNPRFRVAPGNFELKLLYNVPVCERRQKAVVPAEEGARLLLELYERRRRRASLADDLFTEALLRRAALMSSGIIREFLGLLHGACKYALQAGRETVEAADLEGVIKQRRLSMEGYLNQERVDILGRVLAKGTLPGQAKADVLLFENFIACYPNGDIWFRPHELIVNYVEGRSALGEG